MPKVQIDLPNDVYAALKINAKDKYQSLRAYITCHLVDFIRNPKSSDPHDSIDLSILPEGTTIKTTTRPYSNSTLKPKRDLIKEAYEKEGIFSNRVHADNDDPFTDKEYQEEINNSYPYCQNHPDFKTLKQYYDSFTSSQEEISEARERFVGLPHFFELQVHEEPYLYQAFDFTPPADEPTLGLMTYILRLAQGRMV